MSIARDLARLRTPVQQQYGGTPTSFIDGLIPSFISGTSVRFSPGVAYIPGLGRPLVVPNAITLTGMTLQADRWVYFYLYDDNGTPAIEYAIGVEPSSPYINSARTKPGDTSKRFIFAMRTAVGSASFYNFIYQPDHIFRYLQSINATPLRILTNVAPTSPTFINAGTVIPPTSSLGLIALTLTVGSSIYDMYVAHANNPNAIISYVRGSTSGSVTSEVLFPLDSQNRFSMWLSSASGTALVDVAGYLNER